MSTTWQDESFSNAGKSEVDFKFSDGSDFLFSDGSDYVFKDETTGEVWVGQALNTSSWSDEAQS